ncbi:hypothetical protein [Brevibacterium otitidis]|uniref:TadE-like protein n=1 Tax=Brevibacterium otitidis TaxID=53364 RepID=A0ABV5X2D4_9MICO|nr:hypothetical protein GCM10023233_07930 [Brevibacterium otitidis]
MSRRNICTGSGSLRALHRRLSLLRRRLADDAGTAPIEFIFASVVLLIPLVYLILTLGHLQAGSYATSTTAINAARVAAEHPESAQARADALAELHFADFGVEDASYEVILRCSDSCTEPGDIVTAHVSARIPVPGVPAIFGAKRTPHITVTAEHSDVIYPHHGAGGR